MTLERTVAGHRVLRLLARGQRSEVWLAAGEIALKVLSNPVSAGRPGLEAEALHRARGEHVVELLDVSLGAEGAVLVFPRLPRGSLADLLVRRTALDPGEAVTVLAPIAACVARMHAAGVAHRALSPGCVLFRRDGAPVVTGFGQAELFEPGLPEVKLERVAGVVADRLALLELADSVLTRTSGTRAKVAARLRQQLRETPPDQLTARLATELFELATARPVRFDVEPDADAEEGGAGGRRVVPVGEPGDDGPATSPGPGEDAVARSVLTGLADRILSSGPGSMLRQAVGERWAAWSAARRRAVVAAGAAGLALVFAISVVPGPAAPGVIDASTADTPAEETADLEGTGEFGPIAGDESAIAGDDPIAAVRELIARRDRCFRELSMLCLEGVGEAGSSALAADRAALRVLLDGGVAPLPPSLSSLLLVERLGDSALVEFGPESDPASVLLLKGEAGWRIRDYLAAAGDGGG